QRKLPAWHTAAAAESSLHWLQFFDALSLWLCMSRRVDPGKLRREVQEVGGHKAVISPRSTALALPGGGELRLEPMLSTPEEGEWIEVSPWPFETRSLDLKLSARSVPVQHYATPSDLEQAPLATVVLNWRLIASRKLFPPAGESAGEGENP
ncbi:MAG TPA: DUF3891 family protein, partial [Pirellulales bacterium]|nr:DUF3891 family protein [Pirellulales bacterium]